MATLDARLSWIAALWTLDVTISLIFFGDSGNSGSAGARSLSQFAKKEMEKYFPLSANRKEMEGKETQKEETFPIIGPWDQESAL